MSRSPEELIRDLEASDVLSTGSAVATRPRSSAKASTKGKGIAGSTVLLLILAVVLVAVVGSLPFGSWALYPFALFVTLVHESGHAIATLLTGGSVQSIKIAPDLSGLTTSAGGVQALIAPAGYLGATLVGVALLLTPLRFSRWALGALAAAPLAAILLFHPASLFAAAWCVVFAAGLIAAAWKLRPRLRAFLQIFLGVEAGLNAFRDLMTLLFISGSGAHIHTDAENMSRALFLPPMVWAVSWTVISVALVAAALVVLVRRDLSRLRT
ncbi:MAG: M50 family metallopeptidase [Chloroflexota bacterium]